MRDQSLAIRVKQLRSEELANGKKSITDLELLKIALAERKLNDDKKLELLARLSLKVIKDPAPPSVPESQESLFEISEPIRIRDGDNGYLWLLPDQATVDEHDQSNDQALQYLTTQVLRRKRIKTDIHKVRELAGGDGKALYNATIRSLKSGGKS